MNDKYSKASEKLYDSEASSMDNAERENVYVVAYKKAIEIDPTYAVAHNNLAVSYYYKQQYAKAIYHCDKVFELGYRVNPEILKLLEVHRK